MPGRSGRIRAFGAGSPRRRLLTLAPLWLFIAVVLLLGIVGRGADRQPDKTTLRLVTGTENRSLEPLFARFEQDHNVDLVVSYQGSVDTMLEIEQGAPAYDAVWPASTIWLNLGNTGNVVQRAQSIMTTPVVFGVKRSVAEGLGWIGRDVTVEEILAAAEAGRLRYMTTSATQSNSGSMAYLGYLYAFAGHPDVLTADMLHDPVVIEKTRRILSLVDRTAGASGYLRDLFLSQYDAFDGMVNNESAIITANQQLTAQGKEPLYVVYPVDGLAIADWPLGYVDHGDPAKGELFDAFQQYMLSPEVQLELLGQGRRVGLGMSSAGADPAVFNPDWGIDLKRVITPVEIPSPDVLREALVLYQTALRKPSFTVYCLDFSGSMEGKGEREVKTAMETLLDPDLSARYLLQSSPRDVTVVMPFSGGVRDTWRADGNDPQVLGRLLDNVRGLDANGDTNIYGCVQAALDALASANLQGYAPAIIVMSDGKSRGSMDDLRARLAQPPGVVPVYAILFGDASRDQLERIADATAGRIFDGRDDLIDAFRQAKGNN